VNLAIDIGNSRAKLAVFDGTSMQSVLTVESHIESTVEDLRRKYAIKQCIISSVRSQSIAVNDEMQVFRVGEDDLKLPMEIDYETIDTLGNDRVAAAVGAVAAFPGVATLVIDAGTCITYDVVNSAGTFLGGNIAPGLRMRLRSMHDQTGNLPLVEADKPKRVIGKSTREAMINGVALGIDFEIEGYQRSVSAQFGASVTVMTGGDAEYFAERSKTEIFVRPNLVLHGLNEILKVNAG
jgi:type III pantothenate kinase